MSWWTEVLLTAEVLENTDDDDSTPVYPAIDAINGWLRGNSNSQLFLIVPPSPDHHGPGDCFAGHFKGLDRDGFVEAVRSAPWQWREQVQLFMRQEDDRGFIETRVWDEDIG